MNNLLAGIYIGMFATFVPTIIVWLWGYHQIEKAKEALESKQDEHFELMKKYELSLLENEPPNMSNVIRFDRRVG
jgi:uncharacterized membrane protein (DUF106 family)